MSPDILTLPPGGVQAERINGDSAVRLTLRTLLAYLDDILPPAETKELGEKIAASPVASQLVERIREVMRRRRLTAPETDGSGGGVEPNLVAEYLDNILPPERVADLERVCLESDVNLAEVAACHQILTLVLGEPVEIPGRLRERMYALGPQGTPLEVPDPPSPSKNVRETNAREQLAAIQAAQHGKPAPARPAPATKPSVSRVPDYLRAKPLWKRALPWLIVPLLLIGYASLLYFDPTFFPGSKKADPDDAGAKDARVAAVDRRRAPPAEPEAVVDTAVPDPTPEPSVDPDPPAEEMATTESPSEAPIPEQTDPQPAAEAVAAATRTGDPEPAEAGAAATAAPTAETPPVSEGAAPQVEVFATDGVVLRFDARSDRWYPLAADEEPPVGATLAVPDPFQAELTVANLPFRVTALGGTRLASFGQTDAAAVGLDVGQGRLRITGDLLAAAGAGEKMFALRLGRGLWRVEPLTPETVVGIEALPLQPTREGQNHSSSTPQGVLYVAAGAARIADANGRVEVASAGNRMVLASAEGTGGTLPAAGPATEPVDSPGEPASESEAAAPEAALETTPEAADPQATAPAGTVEALSPLGLPDWLTPRSPTVSARRGMEAFKAEFIPGSPADESLLPAVTHRNFNIAEPAAKALGLIEDVEGLTKTLRDAEHEEAILAAIDGIRNWLGRSPENGEILREQLNVTFAREGLADVLYTLLWGYGAEDARDRATADQLVEWLAHPEPVVRELAFYHVKRLSGRTLDYNPLGTQSQRAGAVNRWQAFVGRHGGLVVPPEER